MRWEPAVILGLFALACATACGGGGGHDNVTITTQTSFPQGLLPVRFASSNGSGDVALRIDGDLFAVDGQTADVTKVSRTAGDVSRLADDVGGASNALFSITTGFGADVRLFAGDEAGRIWAIQPDGTAALFVDTGAGQPITGLAFAPDTFGGFGGQLFAAAGTAGIFRISGDPSQPDDFTPGDYLDIAFSSTALLAIDDATNSIVTVSASGVAAALPSTPAFNDPVGMAVDSTASEIYVADAGDGVLYTVPVTGGVPTARAAYSFDPDVPSGLAHDGLAALAFITTDPPAIRGSTLPRINPANANFGLLFAGPTVGYGDLELDRSGAFVIAANDDDDPQISGDSTNNFLISASRDLTAVSFFASAVGSPIEELLGVAVDPVDNTIYFSTRSGNVYRRAPDGSGTGAPFVSVTSNVPVLGLELAPEGFAGFGGWLIATTAIDTASGTGEMFAIDPASPNPPVQIALNQTVSHLSDLVFATDGTLYVVANDTNTSRILRVAVSGTNGAVFEVAASAQLGRADGIEIDDGANRLLVASETSGGGRLLAVDRDSGAVTALANIAIPRGFFPTGVVYDRLGTAVVRERETATSLGAHSVAP